MADVKISQLPAATTPLDGTELTPIVQSGTTKRVSVANLTVGRALTASSLTLSTPLSAANGGTGLTSLGTGIATFLETPTSANLAAAVTDETGTGALVFGTSPTFTTSALFPAGTVSAPGISVSGDTNTGIYFPAADTIGFVEGGVESMRLDASGNLGLGVTPSAWAGSGGIALEIGRTGNTLFGSASVTDLMYNANYNSGWKYANTGYASYYQQSAGNHAWFTAPSGTAGNAISFTQAMTLDASGNLGVGITSSILGKIHTSAADNNWNFYCTAVSGGVRIAGYNNGFASPVIEGVTATASAYSSLVVNGTPLILATNGSERARIDTSGNLLVGTTTTGGKISLTNTPSTEWGVWFNTTVVIADGGSSAFANGSGMIIVTESGVNGASAVYIMGGGQVTLVSTTSSTYWDSATTTPAAGKASIAYSGTAYTLYNNQGDSRTFYVAMLRTRNNV